MSIFQIKMVKRMVTKKMTKRIKKMKRKSRLYAMPKSWIVNELKKKIVLIEYSHGLFLLFHVIVFSSTKYNEV